MPSFFNDGNTPHRSDGMWKIEQKILGALTDLVAIGGGAGSGEFGGAGSPEGVVVATGPAIYIQDPITIVAGVWLKPDGVAGNTGWIESISAS